MQIYQLSLGILICLLTVAIAVEDTTCVNLVKKVSTFDTTLGSRLNTKSTVAKTSTDANFASNMQARTIQEQGAAFVSTSTRSWVSELYAGLASQYIELTGTGSDYVEKIGQDLVDYLTTQKTNNNRFIYLLRHTGTQNHDFIIEQLPQQAGYRIHQTYTDAFDLNAWLGDTTDGLIDNGHVQDFQLTKSNFDTWLLAITSNTVSLQNLQNLPADKAAYLPLAKYVRDYTLADAFSNFKNSWNNYGKGTVIDQATFFADGAYLDSVNDISAYLKSTDGTETVFTQDMWNLWKNIHGAPDLLHYPGLAANAITKVAFPAGTTYSLKVKTIDLGSDETALATNCVVNAKILLSQADSCLNQIRNLDNFDSLLSSRFTTKEKISQMTACPDSFFTAMIDAMQRVDGHEYACGLTRSWVSEVFAGLPFQYTEYKGTDPAWVGYKDVIGADVTALFTKYKSVNSHLIYQLKHVGTQDHDFIVEQLPGGLGYRVYQSYHQAYSLKSWLTPLESDFAGLVTTGDIMVFTQVQEQANAMVSAMTNGAVTLQNLDALPSNMASKKPFLVFVRDYDIQDAQDTLKASWSLFGKGQVIDETTFFQANGYLSTTAALSQYLKDNDMSTNIFSQDMWNNWNQLYGSPNPLYFYDLPFNAIAGNMFTHGEKYSFQIKVVDLGGNENQISSSCKMNSQFLSNALPSNSDCVGDIRRLANFDALLSTRQGSKLEIASKTTTAAKFVTAMTDPGVYEHGPYQSYSCGLTRSWVSEVFAGLSSQYNEVQNKDPADVGAKTYIGQALVDLFTTNRGSNQRMIYLMKHLGTQDHDWIVEQLANDAGYRIYQSYHDAFSLKAWLSETVDEIYGNIATGDLMVFDTLKSTSNGFVQKLTDNKVSLNNLQDLGAQYSSLLPYLQFIRDYSMKDVIANLLKSLGNYGGTWILSSDDFFNNYLAKNAKLTKYLKDNDKTTNPFSQEYWDLWIELYGSPNPVYYPGMPFNAVSSQLFPSDVVYTFSVKVVPLGSDIDAQKQSCAANAEILAKAAQEVTCAKAINVLSNFDATLSSRWTQKKMVAEMTPDAQNFAQAVSNMQTQEDGHQPIGATTVSWVSEVFVGLEQQYPNLVTPGIDGVSVIGNNVVTYFQQQETKGGHQLHVLRHTGTSVHDLLVEQLPMHGGYKIYQSYADAYSLKAWLSPSSTDPKTLLDDGDLVVFTDRKVQMDATLKQLTKNKVSLANLEDLKGDLATSQKPYASFIRDYDSTKATTNFKQAWAAYGQGKVLSANTFQTDYLASTSLLTQYLKENDGTTNSFSQNMWQLWINLYGSPDPLHFYSYKNNAITSDVLPEGTKYGFTVQTIDLGWDQQQLNMQCKQNAEQLLGVADQCFGAIRELITFDSVLSSRFQRKVDTAKLAKDAETFSNNMISSGTKENGYEFACGLTRSYVSEVFAGLKSQYKEYAGKETSPQGYTEYVGDNLIKLFNDNRGNDHHIIYQMKHIGTQDHDYVVEQLPSGAGYRVYQSYHQAYSLLAWLETSVDNLTDQWLLQTGNLMVFEQVKQQADAMLAKMTSEKVSLNNLSDLPDTAQNNALKPFLIFIRDYGTQQVFQNYGASARRYGQGQILDPGFFFNDYLAKTASLTSYLKANDMSTTPFDQSQWDAWNLLYGSPDPLYYPGLPFNTLAAGMFPEGTKYSFQVKVVDLGANDVQISANCRSNAKIILNAVPTDDQCLANIKILAQHDSQLSTRQQTKQDMAKQFPNPIQFVRNLQDTGVTETGKPQSYACGLTRSWVSEVFAGLEMQFTEVLQKDPATIAQKNYIGEDVVNLFYLHRQSMNRIIYTLKHLGTQDHDWVIEQLPEMRGYRVYQSYHDAYSLRAWLADSDTGLWDSGDFMLFTSVQDQANAMVSQMTNKKVTLKNLDDLPDDMALMKPFLVYIRDYNKATFMQNFNKAWLQYGKSQIIAPDDFFTNYLAKTAKLSTYLKSVDMSTTPFSQEYWDLWIELYGSPNPQYFPGLPTNTLAKNFYKPGTYYSFEIKVIDLGIIENCQANADLLFVALEPKKTPTNTVASTSPQPRTSSTTPVTSSPAATSGSTTPDVVDTVDTSSSNGTKVVVVVVLLVTILV